ncbi:hypothetical protein [Geobacter sp. SVR]|uniref:hypothetical protein n=1 Tax=Geobacter sp. SVR TaxID=2495594 RepID=UPI00143F052C|nr:hypothetical protein [Geobacter sp. SVR]BCS52841.1 hypothetical protein GSVR_11490 [Geobacter sp. SVR]GCF86708.1 hypothetical protein GSbR_33080 [Geobacter sp. SVR]
MRRVLTAVLTACALSAATMALAQDATTKNAKDECLLAAKGCLNEVDTIQQKIKRIDAEIRKGTRVYSPDELKKLEQKLNDAHKTLDDLEKAGNR